MGYATTLFAVPLDRLREAIESKDQQLIDRLNSGKDETDWTKPEVGPRIKLSKNGDIQFNGVLVTWDEFISRLGDPMWDGLELHEYTESFDLEGGWENSGEFWGAVRAAMASWAGKGPRFTAWNLCATEEKLMQVGKDEELTNVQAALDLVHGMKLRTGRSFAPIYGYGLEHLCQLIGYHLATIEGKNRLKSLRIDTALLELRCPVSLPFYDDFPYIGYLEVEEVNAEWRRLSTKDLSYRRSRLIEEDRRCFESSLRRAKESSFGIVSFYY